MQRLQQAYREQCLARYEQVIALRKLGMSHAAIAKRVGIGQSTVGNWLAAGAYPETTRGPYVSRLDPYLPYLFERWASGCHNIVRLHQEIVERGYKGSYASVRDHLIRRLPRSVKRTRARERNCPHLLCLFSKQPSCSSVDLKICLLKSKQIFSRFVRPTQR